VFGKNQTGYYNLYYHAGSQGNLPTDIYWASSTNVVEKNWIVENGGQPILIQEIKANLIMIKLQILVGSKISSILMVITM
jgi:hypothetical protein